MMQGWIVVRSREERYRCDRGMVSRGVVATLAGLVLLIRGVGWWVA